jgi:hypothetical protein
MWAGEKFRSRIASHKRSQELSLPAASYPPFANCAKNGAPLPGVLTAIENSVRLAADYRKTDAPLLVSSGVGKVDGIVRWWKELSVARFFSDCATKVGAPSSRLWRGRVRCCRYHGVCNPSFAICVSQSRSPGHPPDSRLPDGRGFIYLVTNRHVAACWDDDRNPMLVQGVTLRANMNDGSSQEATVAGNLPWITSWLC